MLLFGLTAASTTLAGSLFRVLPGLETFPRGLIEAYRAHPGLLMEGVPFALWLLAILGAHEMGHYLACRFYGIPATLPFFLPGPPPFGTFGAVIRIRGVIPDRRALFDVAAAGPLAGYAIALPALVLGLVHARPVDPAVLAGPSFAIEGRPLLVTMMLDRLLGLPDALWVDHRYIAGWFGMLVTSMNLFPVGQLDGGHVAYAFSRRTHRRLALATLVLLGGWILAVPLLSGYPSLYMVWFVILLWLRDRHPPVAAETVRLGPGRRLVALLLLLIFLASFIPIPLLGVRI